MTSVICVVVCSFNCCNLYVHNINVTFAFLASVYFDQTLVLKTLYILFWSMVYWILSSKHQDIYIACLLHETKKKIGTIL